jgi:hypothetical protein
VHELADYCTEHEVRLQHGHFDGEPGKENAQMARNAFLLARRLKKKGIELDAVVLIGDMDGRAAQRKLGMEQARLEAEKLADFRIVLGCPDAKREAWVLNGFDVKDGVEQTALDELRQDLGFPPVAEAEKLDAKDDLAKRSAKRVLGKLTAGSYERERACWSETPLDTLERRGVGTGLASYLQEVRQTLLPLL